MPKLLSKDADGPRIRNVRRYETRGAASEQTRVNHLSSYRLLFKRRFLEVLQRHLQSGFEVDLWFPAEQSFSFGDVRSALFGIVLRQSFVADIALGSGDDKHPLCTLQNGELGWVSDVYRQMFVCL